jgi:N4-gp56 family major capsid protein
VQVLGASPNYKTVPVHASFKMYIPSTARLEIRKNQDFVPVEEAGVSANKGDAFNFNERLEGYLAGCEVYSTPKLYAEWDNNQNLNKTEILIFGRDHTSQIPLRGEKRIQMIVKGLGESGDDRLDRVGSVGWKSWIGAKVLYPERLARIDAYYDV